MVCAPSIASAPSGPVSRKTSRDDRGAPPQYAGWASSTTRPAFASVRANGPVPIQRWPRPLASTIEKAGWASTAGSGA